MLDRILRGKLKKTAIETVTFIQRHFQARDIKPYWSKAQHNKGTHSSTACRRTSFGKEGVGNTWGTSGEHVREKYL